MPPLVSILIPCYNAERWVAQAIESALAQTYPQKEVIVIDDGSTDDSLAVIRRFDGPIRWETGPNRGGNAARNRLLELAEGAWLQYLDADDYLLPDKIAEQVRFLSKRPEIDIVYGSVSLEFWSEQQPSLRPLPIPTPHDEWILLARWLLPQTGGPLWRRQAVLDVGGWKQDQPCCQEHELYLRLLIAGKRFQFCDSGGAVYRQESSQSVCRKDLPEVHRQRLKIEQLLEEHLRSIDRLTIDRLTAINQARFEIARSTWQYSPELALAIVRKIGSSQREFVPVGDAAPPAYRLLYRVLGFRNTEIIAEWRRRAVRSVL